MTAPVEFRALTKTYAGSHAVDSLTASIPAGRITGFLGPNGAGKSTTLRCLLGLARPSSGQADVFGANYRSLRDPLRRVGVVLDTKGFQPQLSGPKNLQLMAAGTGVSPQRITHLLETVELADVGRKPVKAYSLGMRQRLSLASALLGDPELLVLDEPANGLDPLGIAWLREFLRSLQAEGRTVLVSSHQLAEMQNTVDDVLIIHKGKLVAHDVLETVMAGDDNLEAAFLRLTKGVS
mgnify:CR=1 FL=1